jgi:hypothetical protein
MLLEGLNRRYGMSSESLIRKEGMFGGPELEEKHVIRVPKQWKMHIL